jgi:uncharacterized protein (TIGR00255 family)
MISSMTGYGRGEVTEKRITAQADLRSVNNRFLEVAARLPRTLSMRENDVKELVRTKFSRGKVNLVVTITRENDSETPLRINPAAAKAYMKLLGKLRRAAGIKGQITLDHLLKFPEVLEVDVFNEGDEEEWSVARKAIEAALDDAGAMRRREGRELMNDLLGRITRLEGIVDEIERIARTLVPRERERLEERLRQLLSDTRVIDERRLELELTLFADKVDVAEECVRFRSHSKFFREALTDQESAGRRLNFLVQEMNREANTVGSKASNAEVSHLAVAMKEELERIREQLQNIE